MRIADAPLPPVYIIAELGVNHDGSLTKALALVDAAKTAGVDAVKLQYFETDRLMSSAAKLAAYQQAAGEQDPVAMLRRLELSAAQLAQVAEHAHAQGLHAIVTVFSTELVARAEAMNVWDAYKTASPDIIHQPLLLALAATGKPLILSTGAAELDEVERALRWLDSARDRIAVLQCVSSYPTPLGESAIGAMRALSRMHLGPVGYSDHTPEVATGAIAVAAGAKLLEKHLTYDRAAQGPDHAASLDPAGIAEYVRLARAAALAVADERKLVLQRERDVRHVSRQSLVARRDIRTGERLLAEDVTVKRPGTGIQPARLNEILGQAALEPLIADQPIPALAVRLIPAGPALPPRPRRPRTVAVVTGSRAEFGLLVPVMRAIEREEDLNLEVVAAGSHLLAPAHTLRDVEALFKVAGVAPMQQDGATGRAADAEALARGVAGFAQTFAKLNPDWVVVLGDRIEAFAAASAASVGGFALAHIHGGDRAEGIADEAMRHAITKLAHLHFPATPTSAARIRAMGEPAGRIFTVGSPAIDALSDIAPMTDDQVHELMGSEADPSTLVLLHPSGLPAERERAMVEATFAAVERLHSAVPPTAALSGRCLGASEHSTTDRSEPRSAVHSAHAILALAPNFDPGREIITAALKARAADAWRVLDHLPRPTFIALLKRLANRADNLGVLIGNSSAGLIEAAALGLRVINVGPRQAGRERADNVIDISEAEVSSLPERFRDAVQAGRPSAVHSFGVGDAGPRIALVLAGHTPGLPPIDPRSAQTLRKLNTY